MINFCKISPSHDVQRVNNTLYQVNHVSVDICWCQQNQLCYLLYSDLSVKFYVQSFKQLLKIYIKN